MLSFEYSLALLFFGIGGKVQFHSNPKEDIKLLSKPELSMTKILELSDIVLKITMILELIFLITQFFFLSGLFVKL